MRFRRLLVLPVLATLLLATNVAAAGPHTDITFDPQQADKLAHAAMLGEKDLPGDWVALADFFVDDALSSDLSSASPACKNSVQKLNEAVKDLETERVGRATVSLVNLTKGSLTVKLSLDVYQDDALNDLAGDLKGYYGPDMIKCSEDIARLALGDMGATVKGTTPMAEAPLGGAALAYDGNIPSLKAAVHSEQYEWVDGNVYIRLEVSGDRGLVTKELVTAALDQAIARLNKAAGR